MEYRFVYITTASADEARSLGRRLVDAELIACANIIDGMASIYRWQGRLCEERETILIAKTRAELMPALIEQVTAWHSYDCPCIVSLPIAEGHAPYLDWIGATTRSTPEPKPPVSS